MIDRFENFTVSILKLSRLVRRIKLFEMEEYGLKAIHVMCVYYLAAHPEGLTAGELCRLTLEDKAAVSRAMRLLVEKGYVRSGDARYNACLRLTDAGRTVAKNITEKAERAVAAAGKDLTDAERAVFYKALGSITENLAAYYDALKTDAGTALQQ